MISRNTYHDRQGFACPSGPLTWGFVGHGCLGLLRNHKGLDGNLRQSAGVFGQPLHRQKTAAATCADFPFPLTPNKLESSAIKTPKRGIAVCVNLSFFSRLSRHLVWLAVFRTPATALRLRLLTTLLCAPSVVQLQAPLLPTQPAAAKPKARLSARWLAAYRAAYQAFLPATNIGLTAPRHSGVSIFTGPFGVTPRMAFLLFRAPCAHPRKGCYV